MDHRVLQSLSSLSYREGDLKAYLNEIACGVSKLMDLDWSVVTLDLGEFDRILASSVDIGEAADQLYPMHGTVTKTVVSTGEPLTVRDTKEDAQHGQTPEGYRAYLGVPLRSPTGKVLGTICSFHGTPRSFTEEEVRYAELFAERAATALDNYHLYQQQISFNERLEQEVVSRTEELRETQAKLIEKERLAAIGEFTSMIVHEIRNPLTTIEMGLNALGRLDLSENNRLRLSLALEEEVRLKALLNQILQYAKPQVLETSVFDLNHLIRETTGSLSDQPNIQDRNVELVVESSALNINGDRNKLKQVLINLITNACEAVNPSDTV
ncbi:MAG: GAF domain-containing protein, partial [Cyanobacteria bacterium P01_F01_bin.42]